MKRNVFAIATGLMMAFSLTPVIAQEKAEEAVADNEAREVPKEFQGIPGIRPTEQVLGMTAYISDIRSLIWMRDPDTGLLVVGHAFSQDGITLHPEHRMFPEVNYEAFLSVLPKASEAEVEESSDIFEEFRTYPEIRPIDEVFGMDSYFSDIGDLFWLHDPNTGAMFIGNVFDQDGYALDPEGGDQPGWALAEFVEKFIETSIPDVFGDVPGISPVNRILGMEAYTSDLGDLVWMRNPDTGEAVIGLPFDQDGKSLHPKHSDLSGMTLEAFLSEIIKGHEGGPTSALAEITPPPSEGGALRASEEPLMVPEESDTQDVGDDSIGIEAIISMLNDEDQEAAMQLLTDSLQGIDPDDSIKIDEAVSSWINQVTQMANGSGSVPDQPE